MVNYSCSADHYTALKSVQLFQVSSSIVHFISSIIFCLVITEMFRLVYKKKFLEKYDTCYLVLVRNLKWKVIFQILLAAS